MAGDALGAEVAAQVQQSLQVGVSVEEHRCVTGRPQETTAQHRAQQNQNIHTCNTRQDGCESVVVWNKWTGEGCFSQKANAGI